MFHSMKLKIGIYQVTLQTSLSNCFSNTVNGKRFAGLNFCSFHDF